MKKHHNLKITNDNFWKIIRGHIYGVYFDKISNEKQKITQASLRDFIESENKIEVMKKYIASKDFYNTEDYKPLYNFLNLKTNSLKNDWKKCCIELFDISFLKETDNRDLSTDESWQHYIGFHQVSFRNKKKRNSIEAILLSIDLNSGKAKVIYNFDGESGMKYDICYHNGLISIGERTTSITLERVNQDKRQTNFLIPKALSPDDKEGSGFIAGWNRIYKGSYQTGVLVGFIKTNDIENWQVKLKQGETKKYLNIINYIQQERIFLSQKCWNDFDSLEDSFKPAIIDPETYNILNGDYNYYYLVNSSEGLFIRRTPLRINVNYFPTIYHYSSSAFEKEGYNNDSDKKEDENSKIDPNYIKSKNEIPGTMKFFENDRVLIGFDQANKAMRGHSFSELNIKYKIESKDQVIFKGAITGVTSDVSKWNKIDAMKTWSSPVIMIKEDIGEKPQTQNYYNLKKLAFGNKVSPDTERLKQLKNFFLDIDDLRMFPNYKMYEEIKKI